MCVCVHLKSPWKAFGLIGPVSFLDPRGSDLLRLMEDPTPPKRHPGGVWDPVSKPGCLRALNTSGASGLCRFKVIEWFEQGSFTRMHLLLQRAKQRQRKPHDGSIKSQVLQSVWASNTVLYIVGG